MDEKDLLRMPTFVCRTCSIFLDLSGIDRPVTEFYGVHPKSPCPLSEHVVRIDANGRIL